MATLGPVVEPKTDNSEATTTSSKKETQRTTLMLRVDDQDDFALCTLGKIDQQMLDLVFTEGEKIAFRVNGDQAIHVTGYLLPESTCHDDDEMDSDEYDSEGYDSDDFSSESDDERVREVTGETDSEEEDDSEDVEYSSSSEEEEQSRAKLGEKRPAADSGDKKEAKEPPTKKANEEPKKKEQQSGETLQKKTFPNGLIVEDLKLGQGMKAQQGRRVSIYYKGTLASNGKVFDTNEKKALFNFTLGKNEVIKGMEQGILGMALSGERRITVPAALGYGPKGAPPAIPPNATLIFEIKLEKVQNNQK